MRLGNFYSFESFEMMKKQRFNPFLVIDFSVDVYSFLQAPHQNPTTNVASILKNFTVSNETSSLLSQSDSAKILSSLSHQADNLFSDSADRLSLPPLCQFIKSLCRASREQLYRSSSLKRGSTVWWPSRARKQKND